MITFYVHNFGCRATRADAAAIDSELRASGCVSALSGNAADVIVLNTCTVTAAADLQARQEIASLAKRSPASRIIVTGCYAQRAPEELAALPGVTWVVGNSHRQEIARLVSGQGAQFPNAASSGSHLVSLSFPHNSLSDKSANLDGGLLTLEQRAKILAGDIFGLTEFRAGELQSVAPAGQTRPTLKIQDGCNNRCSYCVIPFVRGQSRSMPPHDAIAEIQRLVASGAQEIVLSGINLGSYGRDLRPRVELIALLRHILDETPLARLRLSSIEPLDVTRELVELVASTDRFAQHFHMPLQSGSDRILAAMHRWYRAAHYAEHAMLIRELLPDAAVGADVIAGFPGESEEDHAATCEFIEQLPFTYLHVFSFSERPGTKAAGLAEHVPAAAAQRRARDLRALAEKKLAAFRASQVGRKSRVLTLETKPDDAAKNLTRAVSGNYLDLRVRGNWPANRWLDVRVVDRGGRHVEAVPEFAVAAD
jgi:threonylcarbamoyladenosine tRNA methylthiotransferase MtaB